jgi:hypothetical protein
MAPVLTDLCTQLEVESEKEKQDNGTNRPNSSHILAVQTGSWDLSFHSMRYVTKSKTMMRSFVDTLRRLLSGEMRCGRLRRIVFVTPQPHPLCLTNPQEKKDQDRERDTSCENHRGYRNSANIAALRQYLLNELLRIVQELHIIPQQHSSSSASFRSKERDGARRIIIKVPIMPMAPCHFPSLASVARPARTAPSCASWTPTASSPLAC